MAIKKYEKDGKVFWKVYLNLRHPENPTLRAQRTVQGIQSEKEAGVLEKKLLRELTSELARKSSRGILWEDLLGRWELGVRKQRALLQKSNVNEENPSYALTTIADYAAVARKWTAAWMKMPVSTITKADGRILLEAMREQGKAKGIHQVYPRRDCSNLGLGD